MIRLSKLPAAWDEEHVKRVLAHYEEQTEEEAVAEDEAAVPTIRDLIAKRKSA